MSPSPAASGVSVARVAVAAVPSLAALVFVLAIRDMTAEVALSFLVLALAMSLHAFHAIRGRSNTAADASVFVFGLMFLLVAPIIQISVLGYKLVNTTHATPDLLVQTNLACALFVGTYLLGRVTLFRPPAPLPFVRVVAPAGALPNRAGPTYFSLVTYIAISVFIVLISVPFIGVSAADNSVTPVLLAFRKFLFFVPTALFITALVEVKSSDARRNFLLLLLMVILFACVLATQNPATEKRNGLGPIYMATLFILFRGHMQSRARQVGWLIFVLLLLFPITALLTTVPWKYLDQLDLSAEFLSDHFLTTHYDAWANVYSAIEMTERNGLSGGRQLAGALLFYVPSTWWHGKPLATGIEIGNFLMTYYEMWFTNLSAPLVAEGFLDFGYLGVIAYALGLAALVRGIERWGAVSDKPMLQAVGIYFSFFLVFLLRGSLMIAVAYGCGALAAFVASRLLMRLVTGRFPVMRRPALAA